MRAVRRLVRLVAPSALAALTACSASGTVRSATVRPGLQGGVQAAATGRVGDVAGWFYRDECGGPCDANVASIDLYGAYGWRPATGRPFTLGVGTTSAIMPYVEGYVELATLGRVPVGAGARVGIPAVGWTDHSLYGRADVPLGASTRLLDNPGVVVHTGHSPNGANHGTIVGVTQGVGVELRGERVSLVPSAGYAVARAEHNAFGRPNGPATRGFGWLAVGLQVHSRREAERAERPEPRR